MKVMIVAGGTGGHLYPGIAIARELAPAHEVCFVVRRGDLGREILQKEGFAVQEIAGQGLPREISLRLFTFPFKFLWGWAESWSLLRRMRPDRILGMGGYLTVPVMITARLLGIRTLLHEQNVLPGKANRLLSRWADSVAVSFPASAAYFKGRNVWVSGLPIRADIGSMDQAAGRRTFRLDERLPTFLVFGGSLGAQRLNTRVVEAWRLLLEMGLKFQVLHVAGKNDFGRVSALYNELPLPAKVMPYCDQMAQAYAASDAVICRAGASTVAELLAAKRPAFFVPYPYASDNHQVENARVLENARLGVMVLEETLQPAMIADYLKKAVTDDNFKSEFERAVQALPPDLNPTGAAARLADFIYYNRLQDA